jgi:hypothetical protein
MSANFYAEAIGRLRPGARWGLSPANELQISTSNPTIINNLWWGEDNTTLPPTPAEIRDMAVTCEADYLASEYQRNREPEYPPLANLADALYWQSKGDNTKMDAYLAAIEAVKAKYPKP